MQRHEALQDLSRDHHHALVWAKRLREAADGEAEASPEETADAFCAFWEGELAGHVTEEEHVLLPVYQRHVDLRQDELVIEMLADHAWFRDAAAELQARLEAEEPIGQAMAEIAERLDDHARLEDRQLFPRLEETLDEAGLMEIHRRSQRFRSEHRDEAAIGPR